MVSFESSTVERLHHERDVDGLIATLEHDADWVRCEAVDATSAPDADTRAHAIQALGRFPSERAAETVVAILEDERAGVTRAAAESLAQLRDAGAEQRLLDRAMHALIAALERDRFHPDYWIRVREVEALGRVGDRRAMAALEAALDDGDAMVREAAARALADVAGRDKPRWWRRRR